ncbi:hypothetical protein J4G43_038185 [Bradyrhizobium barranii subsp. barranii]|uniref:Uncharacterized protein n=1 Tax=Bradyrhizobium barranii subsp. barranii TaxID=2823807 RepID=A0A939S6I5_9BRAD|nr:hypothetical protein [Bradyrhizobium barranii]UEM10440.1 hypothetical protein J4G43_038185 [Bradyrhizobium barranii subsp. barranii]
MKEASGRGVAQKLELGRRLAEIRDNTPSNTKFGRLARHQFDRHDPAEVAEMIRVWKRYGDRPDITKKVRNWRVLVAVSSPSLQVPVRRRFETKILAGENVTAKSIAAKAATRKTGRPSKVSVKRRPTP